MKRLPLIPSILLLSLGVSTAACDAVEPNGPDCVDGKCDTYQTNVELDQGEKWEQFRELFRYTSQGSRMVPYNWLLHLEQAESEARFVDPANMNRLGYVTDTAPSPQARALNPDGLPIGLVKDPTPGRYGLQWAGLTCSACHTGEMSFKGSRFLVDGGSSALDVQASELELLADVRATLEDSEKRARFDQKLLGDKYSKEEQTQLTEQLQDYVADLAERSERSTPAVPGALVGQPGTTLGLPSGPGRIDAFTILVNESVCKMLPLAENCRPANAPSNFPYLWGIGDLDWVQANSLAHGVLSRNVGEALGVYTHSSIANCAIPGDPTSCEYTSSLDIPSLVVLEKWLKVLDTPKWPSQFPQIDDDLAAKGEALYARDCESCHSLPEADGKYALNKEIESPCGREYIATESTPICFDYTIPGGPTIDLLGGSGIADANCAEGVDSIGTDPFLASNFLVRKAKTGMLAPFFDGAEEVAAPEILGALQKMLIGQDFARDCADLSEAECIAYKLDATDFRARVSTPLSNLTGYKSRPLAGIAFSAPYLHNGSVPSLRELLLPPEERSDEFWVGRTEYDPQALGFEASPPKGGEEGLFRFDTTIPGNRNIGHAYGAAADDYAGDREQDRQAVLEYLKTLDATPRSQEAMTSCQPPPQP